MDWKLPGARVEVEQTGEAVHEALRQIAGEYWHWPQKPWCAVWGEKTTRENAIEAIRRTDYGLSLIGAPREPRIYPDGGISPRAGFECVLAEWLRGGMFGIGDTAEAGARRARVARWMASWGGLTLHCLRSGFVDSPYSDHSHGWIKPTGEVVDVQSMCDQSWLGPLDLTHDAMALADAFPWLACNIALIIYDDRPNARNDELSEVGAAVHIEGGKVWPIRCEGESWRGWLDGACKAGKAARVMYPELTADEEYAELMREIPLEGWRHAVMDMRLRGREWTLREMWSMWGEHFDRLKDVDHGH